MKNCSLGCCAQCRGERRLPDEAGKRLLPIHICWLFGTVGTTLCCESGKSVLFRCSPIESWPACLDPQGGLVCFYSRAWPTRSAAHRRGGVPPTGGRGGREEFFLEGGRAGWLGSRATQSLGCPSMMSSLTVLAPPTSPSPLVSHAMHGSWSLDSHSTQIPNGSPSRKRNFLPSFVCHLSEGVLPLAPAPRPRGWVDHASLPTPAVTSRA